MCSMINHPSESLIGLCRCRQLVANGDRIDTNAAVPSSSAYSNSVQLQRIGMLACLWFTLEFPSSPLTMGCARIIHRPSSNRGSSFFSLLSQKVSKQFVRQIFDQAVQVYRYDKYLNFSRVFDFNEYRVLFLFSVKFCTNSFYQDSN